VFGSKLHGARIRLRALPRKDKFVLCFKGLFRDSGDEISSRQV
jgi:hypothetical protein